ncbi:CinA family nicotinamide mononucleotide deamidase-related protein [Rubritalea marina]|uniref:CinA family nicotinamide mononucleotide deamidase-related protein n=1 Tax=Rubritalea marina TaxID=361055 RepID=UPI00039D9D83|nr:CinA family nicotinamide mononucleotide deamidase-related protein [Rubritalea marina]
MRIEVLNTGSELLLGITQNTHAAWIGGELRKLGLRIAQQTTVPDGDPVRDAMRDSVQRADVLIVTGGLGPTSDDVTREATAEALGIELIEDEHAVRVIKEYFSSRQREMPDSNLKQALVPCGAEVLPNPNGTAPGVYVPQRLGDHCCAVFLLPGPPRELHPMYHAEVPHRLRAIAELDADHLMLEQKVIGVGESDLHEVIDATLHQIPGLEVGYCARPYEVDVRLIGAQAAVEQGAQLVREAFPSQLVSEDGAGVPEVVLRQCVVRGWKLATAESCTGGLIASMLTDVAGASEVLTHGYVSYANEAKEQLLHVPHDLLVAHGAVSEEVAIAMAIGAKRDSGADIALAVTGVAGPGGGSEEKPVGTAWMAVVGKNGETFSQMVMHPKARTAFKELVALRVLDFLRLRLLS